MDELQDSIAIVGIACQLPGARDKEEFWNNLVQNKESIKRFSDEELESKEFDWENLKNNPSYVKARGIIEDVDKWDAGFFNTIPKDAKNMDPQQRIWLENTWHAFEDAGYDPYTYNGAIGVFAGSYYNSYLLNNVLRTPEAYELYIRTRSPEIFQAYLNNDPMFLATRTAYNFNLKGPAISVQTACSTSLVAVAQACNSLLGYESDMCVAGGVTVVAPQETGYIYQEGGIGSPDGHCRPFDRNSAGTTFSNGVGTVILKRTEDAIKDNDRIYATIRGWATNNDGNQKIGFTAPAIDGQAGAIKNALAFADISADSIDYIEAHGTATPLGDPIEVTALTKAFNQSTNRKQYCGLGSVKSNIGHLDAAAGVAGLIKIALSAYHNIIPATLHYTAPNPRINFEETPFYVVDKNTEWTENRPPNMGVSSFGVGGTNAHIIVSGLEKKTVKPEVNSTKPNLLLLSARSKESLNKMQNNLSQYLTNNTSININNVAYTLMERKAHLPVRSFTVNSPANKSAAQSYVAKTYNSSENQLTFLFPGQGAQYAKMGKELYETEPIFAKTADECFNIYQQTTGEDIKAIIFEKDLEEAEKQLATTKYTQPALFIIEYATAQLYKHYGIEPQCCIGHSIGEYTAACIARVFDLKSALSIVIKRGELMQQMPEGDMLAVYADAQLLRDLSGNTFEIAAINAQGICTISTQPETLDATIKLLEEKELKYVKLNTSHAFHSQAFEPMLAEFEAYVNAHILNAPQIPFISCVSGKFITTEQATSPKYWAQQLRNAVLFADGIETISENEHNIFLEVGPNTHLSGLTRQNTAIKDKSLIVKSIGKPSEQNEQISFYNSIGELWLRGIQCDFSKFYGDSPSLESLPPYAFDKKSYWLDSTPNSANAQAMHSKPDNIAPKVDQNKKQETLREQIVTILAQQSGFEPDDIATDKNFEDMGLDSMFLARFALVLEKKYKCTLEFRKLVYETSTINKLTSYIEANSTNLHIHTQKKKVKLKDKQLENFTPFKPQGNKIPLVMVHGDDLNAFMPKAIDPERPYYGYLHLSADGYKIPFSNIQQIAQHYVNQLLKQKPKGPYFLGGFSFGGNIAFEMALLLEKEGHKVPCLFIIDSVTSEARARYDEMKVLEKMSSKTAKEKKTLRFVFNKYYQKVYYKSVRIIRELYFTFFKTLPVKQRRAYVYDIYNNLALKNKISGTYNGETIIFRASEDGSDLEYLGWEKFTTNIQESILLQGNHVTIIKNQESQLKLEETIKKYMVEYEKENQKL